MAHIRQSRPYSGLGVQVKVLKNLAKTPPPGPYRRPMCRVSCSCVARRRGYAPVANGVVERGAPNAVQHVHVKTRPGFQVEVHKYFRGVASSLDSGVPNPKP